MLIEPCTIENFPRIIAASEELVHYITTGGWYGCSC